MSECASLEPLRTKTFPAAGVQSVAVAFTITSMSPVGRVTALSAIMAQSVRAVVVLPCKARPLAFIWAALGTLFMNTQSVRC